MPHNKLHQVSQIEAAQGNSIQLNNPVQREIQAGELIDGVANAEKQRHSQNK